MGTCCAKQTKEDGHQYRANPHHQHPLPASPMATTFDGRQSMTNAVNFHSPSNMIIPPVVQPKPGRSPHL